MIDPSRIEASILDSLILSKTLIREAERAFAGGTDNIARGRTILSLHDAAELLLGAVAQHIGATLKPKTYVEDYFLIIRKADSEDREVPYHSEIRRLNGARVNLKHLGILPDARQTGYFMGMVTGLATALCERYFSVDFESLSLLSHLRNSPARTALEKGEDHFSKSNFEKAIFSSGLALFRAIGEGEVKLAKPFETQSGAKSPIVFPRLDRLGLIVSLLELGVDTLEYGKFTALVPQFGKRVDNGEVVHYWDKDLGNPQHWTKENARFCLDFMIGLTLRSQENSRNFLPNLPYMAVLEDKIEPRNSEVPLYVWSRFQEKAQLFGKKSHEREVQEAHRLSAGDFVLGVAKENMHGFDEVEIVTRSLVIGGEEVISAKGSYFFADRSLVKIEQQKGDIARWLDLPG